MTNERQKQRSDRMRLGINVSVTSEEELELMREVKSVAYRRGRLLRDFVFEALREKLEREDRTVSHQSAA